MSYKYQAKTVDQLRRLAEELVSKHPKHCRGCFVDIEQIIEARGIEVIYRRWDQRVLEQGRIRGFAKASAICINAVDGSNRLILRMTLAHELSHLLLEDEILAGAAKSDGSDSHELSPEDNWKIEHDAKVMAGEILMSKTLFEERYHHHHLQAVKKCATIEQTIKRAIIDTATDFEVSGLSAAMRAKTLRLITPGAYQKIFIASAM